MKSKGSFKYFASKCWIELKDEVMEYRFLKNCGDLNTINPFRHQPEDVLIITAEITEIISKT